MRYYLIAPADISYQGSDLLTFGSERALENGQLVVVNVRTKNMTGIIVRETDNPKFKLKNIERILEGYVIPSTQLKLMEWMCAYYPAPLGVVARLFVPASILKSEKSNENTDAPGTTKLISLPPPTTQQAETFEAIVASPKRTHIIHGDTGTGKTHIYMQLARHFQAQKKSVIVLIPEISLTPQISEQFIGTLNNVYLIHSDITPAKRREIWKQIASQTEPVVVIGARSALFAPVKNLGIIIIDEFHDSAYKQDQAPRYHAVRTAGFLSYAAGAKLVLGSATPPIDEYFYASSKGAVIHRVTQKPKNYSIRNLHQIVNLGSQSERTKYPLISNTMLAGIKETLGEKRQVLIFLNKRGSSRLIICQQCGWHAACERCDVPYTYHHDIHRLRCHICNSESDAPNSCPSCGSAEIHFKNPGTKAICDSLARAFPNARIGRYDKDNKKSESFSVNQSEIAAGNIDILVGTQLLTKGHDLPKLGMVGVLLAEGNLQFPDFNSEEKTFHLLHQIAGRVGRRDESGTIILQTFSPAGSLVGYVRHDTDSWINFYTQELQQRKYYNFPPYCYMLKIESSRKTENGALNFIQKIDDQLRGLKNCKIEILGPAPSFFYKQNSMYKWQLIVKSKSRSELLSIIKNLPKGCTYDIDPISLL